MEVLHDDTDEHVEDEEPNQEEEGDEVEKTPLIVVLPGLLVDADSVQAMVHDVHPTVLGGEDEQGHEGSAEVVKIVFLIYPAIVLVLQTLRLVGDVLGHNVRPVTVEEKSFEELNPEDAEYDEECAADEDNVSDWFEGREESLDDEFQAGRSVDNSQRFESSDQSEDSQHSEYFAFLAHNGCDGGVHQGDDHQGPVHPVPVVGEVAVRSVHEAIGDGLHEHLDGEDDSEDVVADAQDVPLRGPGGDVGSLHGQRDAVSGDEGEDDEVKPSLGDEIGAQHSVKTR